MPNKHAMLSASSSARWLACPPSAQLCAALPDTVTDYAREGTCAHELAEYKVQKLLGNPASNPTENLTFPKHRTSIIFLTGGLTRTMVRKIMTGPKSESFNMNTRTTTVV